MKSKIIRFVNRIQKQPKVLICFWLFLCSALVSAQEIDTATIATFFRSHYATERGAIVGLSVSVVCDQKQVLHYDFGFADRAAQRAFTDSTPMELASISKMFVGVSLMKAQEMGLLHLDSAVNIYLPFKLQNPYFPSDTIRLRHLASHTSTIHDRVPAFYWHALQFTSAQPPHTSLSDFVSNFLSPKGCWYSRRCFARRTVGTTEEYSNLNASLAALIIERQSGMSFADFTRRYVFEPLQMKNTDWFYSEANILKLARLYTRHGVLLRQYTVLSYPSSSIRSTCVDLQHLMQMVCDSGRYAGQQILSPASVSEMLRVQTDNGRFALFWIAYDGLRGHSGSSAGITTWMALNPRTKNGFILFCNQTLKAKRKQWFRQMQEYCKLIDNGVVCFGK